MAVFDHIVAIYNPNSTHDAEQKAREFREEAHTRDLDVELLATKRPGHAAEIAREIVTRFDTPLLISVSGDGGYNELINGVMQAIKDTDKSPIVAVLPAGNANDHTRTTRGDTPLLDLIVDSQPQPLDLLQLRAGDLDRYAHSYIGLGITPMVGIELNHEAHNSLTEITLVLRSLLTFHPVRLRHDNRVKRYSNLIFANINGMAKVLKLDETNRVSDGKFEVISHRWHGRAQLAIHLLRLALIGRRNAPRLERYTFSTVDTKTPVQLDGEIETLAPDTDVEIICVRGALRSLYEISAGS